MVYHFCKNTSILNRCRLCFTIILTKNELYVNIHISSLTLNIKLYIYIIFKSECCEDMIFRKELFRLLKMI